MNLLRISCVLALLLALALQASAQEPETSTSGFYLGAGVSYNDVYAYDDECWGCYGSAEYGSGDSSFTITAGFRATRYLAVEASYIDQSTLRWNENVVQFDRDFEPYFVDSTFDLSSYQVSVVGVLAGQLWEAYLRAGIALWDAEGEQRLEFLSTGATVLQSFDDSGEDLFIGVGIGRNFGDNWQLRLDYGFFPIDDDLLALSDPYEAYADYMTLQIVTRFGTD